MSDSEKRTVHCCPLAADYAMAMQEQQTAYESVRTAVYSRGRALDAYLFVGEHAPVYTLGLHGKISNLLVQEGKEGVPTLYRTNRGGDITYHGPGQLVVYFVVHLPSFQLGARRYVECLQNAIIATLAEFQLSATTLSDAPGVWLLPTSKNPLRKIAALGIHVNRGITTHGIALNVHTQMTYFTQINPCGFTDRGVTSMTQELSHSIDIVLVKKSLLRNLALEMNFSCVTKEGVTL